MRYCIFCGVNIPLDAKYCQICGKKLPDDTKAANNESLEEKKEGLAAFLDSPKKMIIAGVGAFIIILMIITAIMVAVLN